MALRECPHCTTRVVGNAKGKCPACGGDLAAERPKSKHVRTSVSDVEKLPAVCCRCGAETDKTMWLEHSRTRGGESWPVRILYYLGVALAGVFLLGVLVRAGARGMLPGGGGVTQSAGRKVPVCKECKRHDPPRLEHADLENGELTFAAHRTFARELAKLRGRRTADDDPRDGPYRHGAG